MTAGQTTDPKGGNRMRPAGDRRRADAQRNIRAILDAAVVCLRRDPDTSVADVAKAAGVGRVTLYGHFPSREALVDAVVAHAVDQANHALDAVGVDQLPPSQALTELLRSSWRILDEHRSVLAAGQRHLPANRIRAHHERVLRRVERLIARGQDDGSFRTDLPRTWLVTCVYSILHAAADDVEAGRLPAEQTPDVLTSTVSSLLTG